MSVAFDAEISYNYNIKVSKVNSPAVRDLVNRSKEYSPEKSLYVEEIDVIANIAYTIILDLCTTMNIVIAWSGGHSIGYPDTQI